MKARKSIHFLGIGGSGMSALAELCRSSGVRVTGCDLKRGPATDRLKGLGVPVFIGHSAAHIESAADAIVYSSAIPQDNAELAAAKKKGLAILRRSEALAEMMRLKRGIVVAGTHGKTTAAAMLAHAMRSAGSSPTAVVGGKLKGASKAQSGGALLGKGEWFIAESDESDGSFQKLLPEIALLTNIDDDHVDFYGSFSKLQKAFKSFLSKVPVYGAIAACGDCPRVKAAVQKIKPKVWLYGFEKHNDFILKKEGEGRFQALFQGKAWVRYRMPLIGDHNGLNGLGALVAGWQAGADKKKLSLALGSFEGVERRLEFKGRFRKALVFDDYAHHPQEIQAVLKALKSRFPNNPITCLFQPHRYSRLRLCWEGFLKSFALADRLYISEVYSAGERAEGPGAKGLLKALKHPESFFMPLKEAPGQIEKALRPGDIFITLGAGSVYRAGEELIQRLKKQKP